MKKIEKFVTEYWNTSKFIAVAATVIIAYFGIDSYLDSKIENKITDDNYISELSKTLRPYLIFDNSGEISYDHGAIKFVDSIVVSQNQKGWVDNIIVYCNTYFGEPPLLDFIGVYHHTYEAKRIKNKSWSYDMIIMNFMRIPLDSLDQMEEPLDNMFILEILK